MEYFKIETEEELRQAYSLFRWSSLFSLEKELYFFNKSSLFRFIAKDKNGRYYLTKEPPLSSDYVKIPNPLKNKNKMEYFKIETEEELRQAYGQLKMHPDYSLENELYNFRTDCSYRIIVKNKEGYYFFIKNFLPPSSAEIPNPLKSNKYSVECKGVQIDVYDVLKAFEVHCPATQHAIKKLLKTGNRGHKNAEQDLNEAIESINRAKDLLK